MGGRDVGDPVQGGSGFLGSAVRCFLVGTEDFEILIQPDPVVGEFVQASRGGFQFRLEDGYGVLGSVVVCGRLW